ncbi:MAG: hypothetical protein RSE14_08435 [Erythrobacter sp.]|uniref:hypothetical protein n=1 Tax=Erythrobacter sp. TaxID=1042 RepID=UPI002B4898AE|nr:hypothetical protein [Erythrobacter sp.]WRH69316.1 MAG: hypothetical protein RSE14_08435 [Erythrobacter sp.]
MMDRRIAMLPLLALAGTSLSGCVAAAIPAIAGSAIFRTQTDGKDAKETPKQAESRPAPAVAAVTPRPAPTQNPSVTVMPSSAQPPAAISAPAPVPAPAPAPVAVAVPRPAAPPPATAPRPIMPLPSVTSAPAQVAVAAPRPAPAAPPPAPAVAPKPVAPPPAAVSTPAVRPAPAIAAAPVIAAVPKPATSPAAARPAPAPTPAPVVPAAPRVAMPAPAPQPVTPPAAAPAAAPAPAPVIAAAPTIRTVPGAPASSYPDPSSPLPPEQNNFARFVRYGQASARGVTGGADLASAMLSDPIALDGKRRRCTTGEQLVALIDLDPAGGVFEPPANPGKQSSLALGLAVLRQAGVEIAWLSDLPVNQSGLVRSALEKAGLDPRGQDIISLRRDENDNKQQRKENLAGITCIVAIAGDERADFDERFKYLRNPEAGAGLEPVIGDGWFLITSLFAEAQSAGQ